MPSAKKHLQMELLLFPGVLFVFYSLGPHVLESVVFGCSYIFSSLLLTPDLDLPDSQTIKRWGPMRALWLFYHRIFKHRGLSHNLILGPVTRIVYLLIILILFTLTINYLLIWFELPDLQFTPSFGLIRKWLPIVALGLYIPNFLHIIYDKIHTLVWTWLKRYKFL